jgi:hypothetical protein
MNNPSQPFSGQQPRANGHTLQNRHSGTFNNRAPGPIPPTAASNGPVPVPHARIGNGQQQQQQQQQPAQPDSLRGAAFAGPRSPPNSKSKLSEFFFVSKTLSLTYLDTSHVPCKFYRQGACQAGKACPFLHSDAVEACKYYRKVGAAAKVKIRLVRVDTF